MDDTEDDTETAEPDDGTPRLTLQLSPSFAAGVGYGTVYSCDVVAVHAGEFDQDALKLTVLATDGEIDDFVSSHESPDEIVAEFSKRRENEEHATMPITGFVDEDRTSWELRDVRETA